MTPDRGVREFAHAETERPLMILLSFILLLPLAGLLYQVLGTASDRRRYPPPGQLVDVGGHRLHVQVRGTGWPTVVLEAGIAASSLSWQPVQEQASQFTRVISYDRASLGWSEPGGGNCGAEEQIQQLRRLLQAAGYEPPYVMVGHSFGGLLARVYAAAWPGEIAGLVLVDPVPLGEWTNITTEQARRLARGVMLSRRGAWLARFGVVRGALALLMAGSHAVPRWLAKFSSGNAGVAERLTGEVRKMPAESWPLVRAHWCQPKSFTGMAEQLARLPQSATRAANAGSLPPVPAVIISAGTATAAALAEHAALAGATPLGEHWTATRSGHWVQLDEPELVVQAIRKVIGQLV